MSFITIADGVIRTITKHADYSCNNVYLEDYRHLGAGQARYVRYLESKIANNQPLTADEQIRAKRFGLQ